MSAHYRHTQLGWLIVGALLAAIALAVPLLPMAHPPAPVVIAVLLVAVALLLFSSLTVEVDAEAIRLAFTGALIRKRIGVAEVARIRRVRNRWWYGWGIRLLPGGGRLWNVSGLDAVELVLKDGGRFRIGTDQPAALALAIGQAVGTPAEPAGSDEAEPARAPSRPLRPMLIGAALVVAGTAALVAVVLAQTRPPTVTVTPQAITIRSLFYGASYPISELTEVSLESRLPGILARTNGFAGGGLLRGWFEVQGLGRGRLFVDAGTAPYVVLRTRSGFTIVNFSDPQQTRALYDEIVAARKGSGLAS